MTCFELSGGSKKWGFKSSVFNCSYFSWHLAYSLTSIDCPVRSKTYQRNSKFFPVRKVQEDSETALCGAIENALFRATTKKICNHGQKCWGISMQFSISRHATIVSKTNKFAPSPPLLQCCFNGPSVHFFSYRKQHCNRGGGKRSFNLRL